MTEKTNFKISLSAGTLAVFVAIWVGATILPRLSDILALLVIALVVAAALSPATVWMRQTLKLPAGLAPLAVFLLVFGVLGLVLLSMAPIVALQAGQFAEEIPHLVGRARSSWEWLSQLSERFGFKIASDEAISFVTSRAASALRRTATLAGTFLGGMATVGAVLVTAFFMLLDGDRLRAGFLRLFPATVRPQVNAQIKPITERLGAYVRGVLINMVALGTMLTLGYALIGLPFSLVIGVLTGLLEIIPIVGGAVGGVLAILVGFTVSFKLGVLTVVVFVVAQLIQNNAIGPAVMSKAVAIPPVVLLFALLIGTQLLGLAGAVIAVPVAAATMVLIENVWMPAMEATSSSGTLPSRAPGQEAKGRPSGADGCDEQPKNGE